MLIANLNNVTTSFNHKNGCVYAQQDIFIPLTKKTKISPVLKFYDASTFITFQIWYITGWLRSKWYG